MNPLNTLKEKLDMLICLYTLSNLRHRSLILSVPLPQQSHSHFDTTVSRVNQDNTLQRSRRNMESLAPTWAPLLSKTHGYHFLQRSFSNSPSSQYTVSQFPPPQTSP